MERHVKSLEKLCRICCQKILKSKGYINPEGVSTYSEKLQELLSISVNEVSKEVKLTFTEYLIFINLLKNIIRIYLFIQYNYCNHIQCMWNDTTESRDSFLFDMQFCNSLSILIKALTVIRPSDYYSILLTNQKYGGESREQDSQDIWWDVA